MIREAVNLSKSDPDRWIMLVQFLVETKQLAEAAKAVKDAEAVLAQGSRRPWPWPNALRCWEGPTRGPTTARRSSGTPRRRDGMTRR